MIVIGVTGVIGSGKTTVAGILGRHGVPVIDADRMARSLMKPGTVTWEKIKAVFGPGVFRQDGAVDRKKLAAAVFEGNPSRVNELNCIVHPELLEAVNAKLRGFRSGNAHAVAIDAPLLIETGLHEKADYVIVVKTGREKIFDRALREGREADFPAREKFQLTESEKLMHADFVVDNNGRVEDARKQVDDIWETIKKKHKLQ